MQSNAIASSSSSSSDIPRINVIVKLPFDRPADWVDPPQILWDAEKQALLEEVLSQSVGGKGVEWPALAEHLSLPLPSLLHLARKHYQSRIESLPTPTPTPNPSIPNSAAGSSFLSPVTSTLSRRPSTSDPRMRRPITTPRPSSTLAQPLPRTRRPPSSSSSSSSASESSSDDGANPNTLRAQHRDALEGMGFSQRLQALGSDLPFIPPPRPAASPAPPSKARTTSTGTLQPAVLQLSDTDAGADEHRTPKIIDAAESKKALYGLGIKAGRIPRILERTTMASGSSSSSSAEGQSQGQGAARAKGEEHPASSNTSSFSDLSDASLTPSALDEAMASGIQGGSKLSMLAQTARSRFR